MDAIRKIADERVVHMAQAIIAREGGYNDVKGDKGGATNKGVSLRYARGKGLLLDLDKDGDVDADDIKLVTPEIAVNLYVDDFYFTPKVDMLPEGLRAQVFDINVNGGPKRGVQLLQKVLVEQFGAPLMIDGVNGPFTQRMAARVVASVGLVAVNNALVAERIKFYQSLVQNDPSQAKFEAGWEARAKSFRM